MPILRIKDESTQQWNSISSITGIPGPQGIQGPQGEQGDPGVYVGSTEPTDPNINMWFDTDEQSMPVVTSVNGQTGAVTAVNTLNGQSGNVTLTIPTTISLTLLWTNANPVSTFNAQTIQLDLSEYSHVLILFLAFNDDDGGMCSTVCKVNGTVKSGANYLQFVWSSNRCGVRKCFPTSTGIEFGACGYNNSTNNGYAIPYEIYGIKGVITS